MGSGIGLARNPKVSYTRSISTFDYEADPVLPFGRWQGKREVLACYRCETWETFPNEDMYPGEWFARPRDYDAVITEIRTRLSHDAGACDRWVAVFEHMRNDPELWLVFEI